MAVERYVESYDRPPQSAVANVQIDVAELVFDTGAGADPLAFADDSDGGTIGLARYDAEAFAAEHEDEVVEDVYDAGQRVQYQPQEDAAVVTPKTIDDTNAPAPNIGHRDVVGIVDESSVDAPANSEGRLVEEGYAQDLDGDGVTTTFSRANGNFKAVGVAYRPNNGGIHESGQPVTEYDEPVRVILFGDLKQ